MDKIKKLNYKKVSIILVVILAVFLVINKVYNNKVKKEEFVNNITIETVAKIYNKGGKEKEVKKSDYKLTEEEQALLEDIIQFSEAKYYKGKIYDTKPNNYILEDYIEGLNYQEVFNKLENDSVIKGNSIMVRMSGEHRVYTNKKYKEMVGKRNDYLYGENERERIEEYTYNTNIKGEKLTGKEIKQIDAYQRKKYEKEPFYNKDNSFKIKSNFWRNVFIFVVIVLAIIIMFNMAIS